MVVFVKQISAVSPATVCSIFLSFAISKEDWAIKLITHLLEVIYTLRLLRKGKFHSCTWSNGYTWRKWPLDPFRCSEHKTCLTLSYLQSCKQYYCSQICAAPLPPKRAVSIWLTLSSRDSSGWHDKGLQKLKLTLSWLYCTDRKCLLSLCVQDLAGPFGKSLGWIQCKQCRISNATAMLFLMRRGMSYYFFPLWCCLIVRFFCLYVTEGSKPNDCSILNNFINSLWQHYNYLKAFAWKSIVTLCLLGRFGQRKVPEGAQICVCHTSILAPDCVWHERGLLCTLPSLPPLWFLCVTSEFDLNYL